MLKFRNLVKILSPSISYCRKSLVLSKHFNSSSRRLNDKDDFNNYSKENKYAKNNFLPALRSDFENIDNKTKQTFLDMITIYEEKGVKRRNHVEFIYAALKNMEPFGVHNDIEVYKALINVMPKGKFIPTNIYQAEFMHYPKQQQCIIDLLEQMEDNGVMPDYEMEAMLLNVFGKRGHPLRKYWRMMYWMPKFKNLSPWPLPNPVPNEALELARMAVERMCTVDLLSKIDIFDTKEVENAVDETWIVSGISKEQTELLNKHDKTKPIYIEGPFLIWLRNKCVNYFTLRGDPNKEFFEELEKLEKEKNEDDVRKIDIPYFGQPPTNKSKQLTSLKRSVHQQEDGTIFGICATGTSSKDSLLSWIRLLQKNGNPVLSQIPILFRFRTSIGTSVVTTSQSDSLNININNKES